MKNLLITFLLPLILLGCQSSPNRQTLADTPDTITIAAPLFYKPSMGTAQTDDFINGAGFLMHIGYYMNYPVFSGSKGKVFISKETGKLHLFRELLEGQTASFINDSVFILLEEENIFLLFHNGKVETLKEGSRVVKVIANSEMTKLIITTFRENTKIIDLITHSVLDLNLGVIYIYQLIGDTIYYRWGSKILKANINRPGYSEEVSNKVVGELSMIITPDQKYLMGYGYHSTHGLCPTIVNVETGVTRFPDVYPHAEHYYSYQENAVVFYHPNTFEVWVVKP
jgi:hypothetical protein